MWTTFPPPRILPIGGISTAFHPTAQRSYYAAPNNYANWIATALGLAASELAASENDCFVLSVAQECRNTTLKTSSRASRHSRTPFSLSLRRILSELCIKSFFNRFAF
jgi:hypothetical protein